MPPRKKKPVILDSKVKTPAKFGWCLELGKGRHKECPYEIDEWYCECKCHGKRAT